MSVGPIHPLMPFAAIILPHARKWESRIISAWSNILPMAQNITYPESKQTRQEGKQGKRQKEAKNAMREMKKSTQLKGNNNGDEIVDHKLNSQFWLSPRWVWHICI